MFAMINKAGALLFLLLSVLLLQCTMSPLAGGSDNPDFIVTGAIVDTSGQPAQNTMVTIAPASYNPITDTAPTVSMTDANGVYRLTVAQKGAYIIQAVHRLHRTRLLVTGISINNTINRVETATLKAPGTIKIFLPPNWRKFTYGYFYAPGTSLWAPIQSGRDTITLDSVPCGTLPSLSYAASDVEGPITLRYNIPVIAGDTTVVRNPSWKYCSRLLLNTTVSGADISGTVSNFPILIRLNSGNFDFLQANSDGSDLRFTKTDNSLLPYEIERWDLAGQRAEIWVKVDSIYGNNSTQAVTMYWGNNSAVDSSNGAAVFDTSSGFRGVWHLGQSAGAIIPDATCYANSATATATTTVDGIIGTAQRFNGVSSVIQAYGPADSVLNFPANGVYSVSAWVSVTTLDSLFHGIVYKSNFQYGLQVRPENTWEFMSFIDKTGWEGSRRPAIAGSWHFLTGVRNGTKQYLFVDGIGVDSTQTLLASNLSRLSDTPLEIGHCPDGGQDPDRYFSGMIDEVRIANVASSPNWIKLCYMNQKEQDALVKW
jgi:hypothetical protein